MRTHSGFIKFINSKSDPISYSTRRSIEMKYYFVLLGMIFISNPIVAEEVLHQTITCETSLCINSICIVISKEKDFQKCTAFLVGPVLAVTSSHCLSETI